MNGVHREIIVSVPGLTISIFGTCSAWFIVKYSRTTSANSPNVFLALKDRSIILLNLRSAGAVIHEVAWRLLCAEAERCTYLRHLFCGLTQNAWPPPSLPGSKLVVVNYDLQFPRTSMDKVYVNYVYLKSLLSLCIYDFVFTCIEYSPLQKQFVKLLDRLSTVITVFHGTRLLVGPSS